MFVEPKVGSFRIQYLETKSTNTLGKGVALHVQISDAFRG
jgi:hypothetical protein